ncbi:hypothetical protein ACOSP6_01040 [Tenacibaculum sp. MEBiC06402]|uniref:hypothetical protein n=1 Tax=unclassified Tenacibaculum TaxID=2635139 RepID=UPI003B9AB883
MKNHFNLLFALFFVFSLHAQKEIKDKELKSKLDSIIAEADLLYTYEKVAWKSTDILLQNQGLKQNAGGYLVYHSKDSVFGVFTDKGATKRIAKYSFSKDDLNAPFASDYNIVALSSKEKKLLEIKSTIVNQFSNPQYQITIPNGYNPNLVLIEGEKGYQFYIIMGTNHPEIIPFGNDYVFKTDEKGIITSWRKFHKTMIPAQSKMADGSKVISAIHSHLKMTPLITATDICTFRLYGELYGMSEFMVLSTALGKYFKYILKSNTIEVTDIK